MTRTLLIAALLLSTIACNESKKETAEEAATVTTPETPAVAPAPHEYALKANYSSAFEAGDAKQGDIVVELWKQFDDDMLDKGKDFFADTVTMWSAEGWKYHGTSDSLLKMVKADRSKYSAAKSVLV